MRLNCTLLTIATVFVHMLHGVNPCGLQVPPKIFPTDGLEPLAITISSNGNFCAVANNGGTTTDGDITMFLVDEKTATLTKVHGPLPTGNFATTPHPTNLAFSPTNDHLSVISGSGTGPNRGTVDLFKVDQKTGFLTHKGTFDTDGADPHGIDYSPDGRFLSVANAGTLSTGGTITPDISVFSTNCHSGKLTKVVGPNPRGNFPSNATSFTQLKYTPQGTYLLVVDSDIIGSAVSHGEVLVYLVDATTGGLTKITGPSPKGNFSTVSAKPDGITISPDGRMAVVASGNATVTAFSINEATGVLTRILGTGTDGNYDLVHAGTIPAFSPTNKCLSVALPGASPIEGNVTTFHADTMTRTLSDRADYNTSIGNTSLTYSPDGKLLAVANRTDGTVKLFKTHIEHFIPLTITSPKNGETITDEKPVITGTATPGEKIVLKTYAADHSFIILGSGVTDKKGVWSIKVTKPLVGPLEIFACLDRAECGCKGFSCAPEISIFVKPKRLAKVICVEKNTAKKIIVIPDSSHLPITITIISKPRHGTATICKNGKDILYTPKKNFTGCDFITIALTNTATGCSEEIDIALVVNCKCSKK